MLSLPRSLLIMCQFRIVSAVSTNFLRYEVNVWSYSGFYTGPFFRNGMSQLMRKVRNEFHFSAVYRSINYIVSRAK